MSKTTGGFKNVDLAEVLKDGVDRSPYENPTRSWGKSTMKLMTIAALVGVIVGVGLPTAANAKAPAKCSGEPNCAGGGGTWGPVPIGPGRSDIILEPPDMPPGGDSRKEPRDQDGGDEGKKHVVPKPPKPAPPPPAIKSPTDRIPVERGSKNNPSGRQRE